ncbi:MAG: two-component regulator propeller domain-containing protein [Thermoanaerobaculia bacterium]
MHSNRGGLASAARHFACAAVAASLFSTWAGGLSAETARYVRFTNISLEQGLSQSAVNCILQDHRGYMWFGTQDGLNRWDGYDFTVFKNDPQSPDSLPANVIWALHEDGEGSLWIGTDGGGLARLDLHTNSFSTLRNDLANTSSLSSNRVRSIAETPDGALWVGTDGGGLNRLNRRTGAVTRFLHDPSRPDSLANDRVRALAVDAKGSLWVGTQGGLDRLDAGGGGFLHYRNDPGKADSLGDDRIRSLLVGKDGTIWVGGYAKGLDRLDPAGVSFSHFRNDPKDAASLSDNTVWSLLEDSEGTLWVGTNNGLNALRKGETAFARYVHQATDPASLADSRVLSLHQDRGGVVWVGTQGSGLDKWNPLTGAFVLFKSDLSAGSTLSNDFVQAFATAPDGTLIVGTWGGLNIFDPARRAVHLFRHDPKNPASLADDRVMTLAREDDGTVWVGTLEAGLDRFDPARGTFRHFRRDAAKPSSLSGNGVTSLLIDHEGVLWIGVMGGGLNRYQPVTETFVPYRHDAAAPASLSDDNVLTVAEDSSGTIWVGTEHGGLNRFDRASGGFASYRNNPARADSLAPGVVFCVHEDRKGTLWIGTQGGGLSGWSPEDRKAGRAAFRRYGDKNGLPNDTVYGILEDEKGTLWLSTNRGLSNFDPEAGTFRNFDQSYGLQSNEFNFGASHRSASGEMFFGGINGFNAFFPERIRRNAHMPPVLLTGFYKLTKPVRLPQDISETTETRLTYKDYVVSFEFAALDYTAPAKNRYAYMLEGFDRDWIDPGSSRRATYTNLPAGRFVFRVKGSNSDGVWNEKGASLGIVVEPPPWKSAWAYMLYALAIAGAVAYFVRRSRRQLEQEAERGRLLEAEVQKRTKELGVRNEELRDAIQKLQASSLTDSLTGLHNRRFLMTEIDKEIGLVDRYYASMEGGGPDVSVPRPDFVLLMVDLDGFKPVNDSYGHAAGDRVLLEMKNVLERACRRSDTILRWGGDEFLVIGRFAQPSVAEALAQRICSLVAEHSFDLGEGHSARLTCSIGFAFFPFIPSTPRGVTWEQVVIIADRALYVAKASGKNAWVGIFSTKKTPTDNIAPLINSRLEIFVLDGSIELHTSFTDPARLVLGRV